MIWNRFRPGPLDIDGELEMECIDSGMVMLDPSAAARLQDDTGAGKAQAADDTGVHKEPQSQEIISRVLEFAYREANVATLEIETKNY